MKHKPVVCLFCGGQSPEHEISLLSGWNVFKAIDRDKYSVKVVGINKEGVWNLFDDCEFLLNYQDPSRVRLIDSDRTCFIYRNADGAALWELSARLQHPIDVAFPVLHGENGEDGSIQGLFQMVGIPFVGCDQKSSANCMDKAVSKVLLRNQDLPVARALVLHKAEMTPQFFERAIAELALPIFVKPACTGSSIGVHKIKQAEELQAAIEDAFLYDQKILLEEAIEGREIECAVLEENGKLFCPRPGEVIPHAEFYSYAAKYLLENGATLKIPCELADNKVEEVRCLALKAFETLECKGLARVDFFLKKDGSWIVNEINTIPGFTKISLYPQLMIKAGISYSQLVDRMLSAALKSGAKSDG